MEHEYRAEWNHLGTRRMMFKVGQSEGNHAMHQDA